MKYLLALSIVALIMALTSQPDSIQERVEEQIEHSEALHDSAMIILREIHIKNDSLLDAYFPIDSTAK